MEAVPQPADPVRSAHARRNPTPWNKSGATARENSPYRSHIAPLAGQNSPCSHKMAQFGRFYPCRENFIPLSPATSRAGRTFSRTSPSTITGLIETTPQHDTPSGAMKHFPPQLHTPHRSMKHLSPQRATNGSSPVEWCNRFVSFGLGYALSWSGVSSCWVGCGVSRDLVRMSRLR